MSILRKRETFEQFKTYADMSVLLDEMNRTDQWLPVNMAKMKIGYVPPCSTPEYIYQNATTEQVDAAYKQGTMVLKIGRDRYLINPTAYLTLGQSTETCCRLLSKFLSKEHYAEAAEMYNKGLSFLGKDNTLLIRGQQVMAFFSKNYCVLDQKIVFQKTNEMLTKRFTDAKFLKGTYTPEESTMLYQLCGEENKLFQKYKTAWINSGFDENELNTAKAYVRVTTGDTGQETYKITPLIFTRSWIPLGEAEKIKHYGKVSISDVEGVVNKIFANLENGMDKLADMMGIDINYPITCMEKVMKDIGLGRVCPSIVEMIMKSVELLEVVRTSDPKENKITAFTLYQTLLDAQYYPAFQKLEKQTKLKAWECFYRATAIDWGKF